MRCADIDSVDCLSKNQYNESKCSHLINALYECCAEFYKRRGKDAKSVCCPSESLLQLKISQRRKEEGGAMLKETKQR
ncbi:Cx9C motif-containing protein 4, mitochondrial [Terfezia claveryi]|nr:Cx9C motif-containing protein 4, mitochondrial [Terfezia claveryi]